MRHFILILFTVLGMAIHAQNNIMGDWYGQLNIMGTQMKINLHFYEDSTTLDSPDQNAYGFKAKSTQYGDTLHVVWESLNAEFSATKYTADTIIGTYQQMGRKFDLNLSRKPLQKTVYVRPQHPKPPFDYDTSIVSIPALDQSFTLAGTLIDVGKETAIVLASGSGPQDRNSTIMHHKPFWVIADHLAQNGISTLRFDDRGVAESGGNFSEASIPDFANDISACVNFLHRKGFKKIGVIGHSEGGMTAPLAATKNKKIDFVILLAPPGVIGDELIMKQQALISKQNGASEDDIRAMTVEKNKIHAALANSESTYQDSLRSTLSEIYEKAKADGEQLPEKNQWLMQNMMIYGMKWYRGFILYDPIPALQKIKIPVGVIQGENDIQVDADQNVPPIKKALEKGPCKTYKIERLPKLNHLLQESKTGAIEEYVEIEQTIHPQVLSLIVEWTKDFTK